MNNSGNAFTDFFNTQGWEILEKQLGNNSLATEEEVMPKSFEANERVFRSKALFVIRESAALDESYMELSKKASEAALNNLANVERSSLLIEAVKSYTYLVNLIDNIQIRDCKNPEIFTLNEDSDEFWELKCRLGTEFTEEFHASLKQDGLYDTNSPLPDLLAKAIFISTFVKDYSINELIAAINYHEQFIMNYFKTHGNP